MQTPAHGIPLSEAVRVWAKIAALSFGGPAGQIAVMHRVLVEEKKWIGEERFLHALNYCMLLPGPEAQQLATYIGWLLHKTKGGLIAGALFILPGFLAILALSYVYVLFGDVDAIEGLFFGLKAAVLAVVLQAVVRVGSRALKNNVMRGLAAAAFVAIFVFDAPFPLIVLAAGAAGFIGGRSGIRAFQTGGGGHGLAGTTVVKDADTVLGEELPSHARPSRRRSVAISAFFLVLWLAPVGVLLVALGPDNVFTRIAIFFSQMAVVTFGGAYAVLAYVAQEAVGIFGWVTAGEMLDGLGMAETTPGPLINPVRRLPRRDAPAGRARSAARSHVGRDPHHLGDLHALFPLDISRCPLRGATEGKQSSGCLADRDHRRRGRSDSQPGRLVCPAHHVRGAVGCARADRLGRGASSRKHQHPFASTHAGRRRGCIPVQGRRADCARGVRRSWNRPSSQRPRLSLSGRSRPGIAPRSRAAASPAPPALAPPTPPVEHPRLRPCRTAPVSCSAGSAYDIGCRKSDCGRLPEGSGRA